MEEGTNPNICQFQRKGFYDLSTCVCKFYSTAIINVIDDLVYDNQYESSLVYEEDLSKLSHHKKTYNAMGLQMQSPENHFLFCLLQYRCRCKFSSTPF